MAHTIAANGGPAAAAVRAIQIGDISSLRQVLEDHPGLVNERIDGQRTLLHVATDWPGNFPNNAVTVVVLIASGAAVNSPFIGRHSETPLHWAASGNDVDVLDVLLDHGADIEAPGGVIGGGTPLADAVSFGQWRAARRLVERGAAATLWQAAALGLMDRVKPYFAKDSSPSAAEVTQAFWCACHGGRRVAAEYLLGRGVDLNWVGYDGLTPLDAASRNGAESVVDWLRGIGAKSATNLSE
ncbi:MAG: ankyrin repeat domain-containing protein [Bryobacteraceae bacterium]